ncbi:MAG TPA: peptidase, partial [Nitrosopumilus sp.]|nr:peptidase [Nitrosopumilus sp.]
NTFIRGIEYLIKNQIIVITSTTQGSGSTSNEIPSWIRNNAAWWANGEIDDETFIQGLKFLIQKGIIHV